MRRQNVTLAALGVLLLLGTSAQAQNTRCPFAAEEGQKARAAGKLREAQQRFRECLSSDCPAVVRSDCTTWAAEVAALLPSIVIDARDERGRDLADVVVTIDGEVVTRHIDGKSIAVDPGPHEIRFDSPGRTSILERIITKEGVRARQVTVAFGGVTPTPPQGESAPTTSPAREHTIVPWILFGVGAAATTTGLIVALTAPSLPSGCDANSEKCTPFAGETSADFTRRQEVAGESKGRPVQGFVMAGAGAALMVGGLLWHFLERTGPAPTRAAVRVAPFVTVDRAGAVVSATF